VIYDYVVGRLVPLSRALLRGRCKIAALTRACGTAIAHSSMPNDQQTRYWHLWCFDFKQESGSTCFRGGDGPLAAVELLLGRVP
jgi:hypothetical protein